MKKATKLLGIVLIIALVMSMGIVSAFAADYSITVANETTTQSIVDKTYYAYKVFDVTYADTDGNSSNGPDAYAYSINAGDATASPAVPADWAWATLVDGATTDSQTGKITTKYGIVLTPSASDPTVYSVDGTNMSAANARALADALKSALPATADGSKKAESETVTIELDEPGYYAVYGVVYSNDPYYDDSDDDHKAPEVVAAVSLTTTDPTVTINPKASVPTLNKQIIKVTEADGTVTGGSTVTQDNAILDADGQAAVAKIGSTVSYQIDATAPDTTGYSKYTYTMHDSLTSGLDYVEDSFRLTVTTADGPDEDDLPDVIVNNVDVSDDVNVSGRAFTYTIPFDVLKTYPVGAAIVLTYDCTVNENALTYDYENNTAYLEYTPSPYGEPDNETTPPRKTYVIDLNIDVDKIDGSTSGKRLAGAEFKLYREVTVDGSLTKQYYKWVEATNTEEAKVTWTDVDNADVFTTNAQGSLNPKVCGLDKGTYYLIETKAPTGYNPLKEPVKVDISVNELNDIVTYSATYAGKTAKMTNGVVDLTAEQTGQPVATGVIENNSGTVLPGTGGIGTTIFYVVGSIMVVAAGVLLVTKKRMSREG